jgi:L-methionine (R)-S-oxide reductase
MRPDNAAQRMTAKPAIEKLIRAYLFETDLESLLPLARSIEASTHDFISAIGELPYDFDEDALYRYPVPMLTEDGSCSLADEIAPAPYDLGVLMGGRSANSTRKLLLLRQLVNRASEVIGADWLGIYQRRGKSDGSEVLVKLAYRGRPSRAEFPLTAEFAHASTNASVGLSGKARVIGDVEAYMREGGGFYVCDVAVQSEVCLPILWDSGLVGIIDAEASPKLFFSTERLATLVALALVAPACLP